ncbi:MAG: hypothetical protein JNK73_00370 [Bacteroidia bacterium]|nr:hypothetical protein [Bacteroidia bacterium]
MATKKTSFKKQVKQKLLNFQKNGWLQYGKYLKEQFKQASKSKLKKAYSAYLEKEMVKTELKLHKLEGKIRKA